MPPSKPTHLIRNAEVLEEAYLPKVLTERETQAKSLSLCLAPTARRLPALNAWVFGPTGSGKTVVARHVLSDLAKNLGVRWTLVNCWQASTLFAVADQIVRNLRVLGAEAGVTRYKLERIQSYVGDKPFVIVLDEIDRIGLRHRNNVIYNLAGLKNVSLVCIAQNNLAFSQLDEGVRARLNPVVVEFSPYSQEALYQILTRRAAEAFAEDCWDGTLIHEIVKRSDGNARLGVQMLLNVGRLAERTGAKQATHEHIASPAKTLSDLKKETAVALTPQHRLILSLVHDHTPVLTGNLWRFYLDECRKRAMQPVADNTFLKYLKRLRHLDLVESEIATRPRTQWTWRFRRE